MGRIRWYKRDPNAALILAPWVTLEEWGAYNGVVDLIYLRVGTLPDDEGLIASVLHCDVRVWRRIRLKLLNEKLLFVRDGLLFDCGRMVAPDRVPISGWMKRKIFERDGSVCKYCGDRSGPFEIDHIFPVSRGGQNHLANLTIACRPCNRSKRAKTEQEWRA